MIKKTVHRHIIPDFWNFGKQPPSILSRVYNPLTKLVRRIRKLANITVSATAGMMLIGSAFAMFVTAATNKDADWLKWCALGFAIMGAMSWYWAIAQAKQYDNDAKQDRGKLFKKLDDIISLLRQERGNKQQK